VHRDAKAIYVRGFRAGDRLQSVPLPTTQKAQLMIWPGRLLAAENISGASLQQQAAMMLSFSAALKGSPGAKGYKAFASLCVW